MLFSLRNSMCARYKDSSSGTPNNNSQGGGVLYSQAAPRKRVPAGRYEEEEETSEHEAAPLPIAPAAPKAPRNTPARRRVTDSPAPLPGYMEKEDPLQAQADADGRRVLHSDTPRNPESAFGTPGPKREYRRTRPAPAPDAEENPWSDLKYPPKKGTSFWQGLGMWLFFPFRMIAFITRKLPWIIKWGLRLLISGTFVGSLFALILIMFYAIKSGHYDLTLVMRMPERTIVQDRKGNEIGTLHGENRRSITDLKSEVPTYFIDALILQEDRSYWTHGGIDPRGMLRAVAQVFKHGRTTQGGSTLTMQLAKNTYQHRVRNFDAKFTEMALARRIEATYDKDTILMCYINRVFWGHTFLGLKQAAYGYFSKEPRDLTIGEAAMLAGIVCNPNTFSPYRNPEFARIQRDKVLRLLMEHGKITRTQYETALAEEIVTKRPERRGIDNYALDLIRSEVDHILEMLDTREERLKESSIISGGLIVRTTLDVDLQDAVMQEINSQLESMLENGRRYPHQTRRQYQNLVAGLAPDAIRPAPKYVQAACVMIDNATGALLSVVGGRDSTESPLNRALQSRRQVGSIFKPLVYATFFEQGGSPNSMISDGRIQPGEIPGGSRWSPRNSDGRFTGRHPASWGLLKSRNTMSVRVGARAGLQNVVNTALMSGFPQPQRQPGPTIYLGTWEASPLEVAGAYTAFANGGVRPTPYIIESITDSEGRIIWQNPHSAYRIYSQKTANAISAVLQQITKPGGTAGSMQRLGFTAPAGGKTGTTNAYRNAWFCGFTSDITAAVWVGFDRPTTIADRAYGGTIALPIWVSAMKQAQRLGYHMGPIRQTAAGQRNRGVRLCRTSGGLAHAGCEYRRTAYTETMTDITKPRSFCTEHPVMQSHSADDELAEDPNETELPDDDIAVDPESETPLFTDDDVAEAP